MKELSKIYNKSFFGKRNKLDWRVPIVCNAVENTFNLPQGSSIIDVGCANGEFIEEFAKRGFTAHGIEGSSSSLEFSRSKDIYFHDLRKPLVNFKTNYDLCICLEVAEHIEEEFSKIFIDNICSLSTTILISAAPPGAKGHYHVNCQPQEYWEDFFTKKGYIRSFLKENSFKNNLESEKKKKGISAYYHAMIYRSI